MGADPALAASVCNYGLIPGELTERVRPGSGFPIGDGLMCVFDPGRQDQNVVTSMFMHGSWLHLLGNMWFLWLFGNNIEDVMTGPRYVVFYLGAASPRRWPRSSRIRPPASRWSAPRARSAA